MSEKSVSPLELLKSLTSARVGLNRVGTSLSTQDTLAFELDHARARDAVHLPFNLDTLLAQLSAQDLRSVSVKSAATHRIQYLQRPDLGRRLEAESRQRLANLSADDYGADIAIIIADGLSTTAIHQHALPLIQQFLPVVEKQGWRMAPIVVASQARVALADEIGELLSTKLSVIIIGERPGLSAFDSMGIYITYAPKVGRTDAERNCISNIRMGGLDYVDAAAELELIIRLSLQQGVSGVKLQRTADNMKIRNE